MTPFNTVLLQATTSVPTSTLSSTFAYTSPHTNKVMATLEQLFVVGPGYPLIPHKLSELIAANLIESEQEANLLLDRGVLLKMLNKHARKWIKDILSWVEAFSFHSLASLV